MTASGSEQFERACLNTTYTRSETEPEPQGGDYLSAEG